MEGLRSLRLPFWTPHPGSLYCSFGSGHAERQILASAAADRSLPESAHTGVPLMQAPPDLPIRTAAWIGSPRSPSIMVGPATATIACSPAALRRRPDEQPCVVLVGFLCPTLQIFRKLQAPPTTADAQHFRPDIGANGIGLHRCVLLGIHVRVGCRSDLLVCWEAVASARILWQQCLRRCWNTNLHPIAKQNMDVGTESSDSNLMPSYLQPVRFVRHAILGAVPMASPEHRNAAIRSCQFATTPSTSKKAIAGSDKVCVGAEFRAMVFCMERFLSAVF